MGVTVGSRGIDRLSEVVTTLVLYIKDLGADPVIIPAMGSHGGANAEGQAKVLYDLGIDEARVGAPVEASMEVEEVGRLRSGYPVYTSKAALSCDRVILVNRVKPHTEFRAPIESGLTKMLAIGLGKESGASSLHRAGMESFDVTLPEAAASVLTALKVAFGVALIEDEWHRLLETEILLAPDILLRESTILTKARSHLARLPIDRIEVLVLREMGKTISGTGMDTNVTGRFPARDLGGALSVQRLVVLDLTAESSGNAVGVGLADIVPERLRSKIDWEATYANVIASKAFTNAKLPLVMRTDHAALSAALVTLTGQHATLPRLVAMRNTLEVNHLVASPNLTAPFLGAGFTQIGEGQHAEFGDDGQLSRIGELKFFPSGERW